MCAWLISSSGYLKTNEFNIFTFIGVVFLKKGGSISAKGGPYLLGDLDRGSISTRRFGPGVQIYWGVQIRCDTGPRIFKLIDSQETYKSVI